MRRLTRHPAVLLSLVLLFCFAGTSFAQSVPAGFSIEPVHASLGEGAVGFAMLPDGRILVIYHQSGVVRLLVGGTLKTEPLLQVPGLAYSSEQGLLGIAVDPDYPDSNYVYLFHTRNDKTNRVSRFRVGGDLDDPASDALSIAPETEETLLVFPDSTAFHNGGTLRFGRDKTLYVSHGDDVQYQRIQDLTTLYGKILRINRDGSVPDDNPAFPDEPEDRRPEIFAFGLRNPYRFNIDPETDVLFIGDVGTNVYEEFDLSVGGENFGYPRHEGYGFFRPDEPLLPPEPTPPIHAYPRSGNGRSAIGLATYRPKDFPNDRSFPPEYDGVHFHADFFDHEVRYLRPDGQGGWASEAFGAGFDRPIDATVGPDGSLYVLEYGGGLHRIAYVGPSTSREEPPGLAAPFTLDQNHPNPFADETTIAFTLATPQPVTLAVFDVLGRRVATLADGPRGPGRHTARLDAQGLAPGLYFYHLQAGPHRTVRAMLRVTSGE